MMKRILSIVLTGILCGASLMTAQDVQLTAKIKGDTFRLGDWIDVHVDARIINPVDTIAPAVKDSIGSFELLSFTRDGGNPSWTLCVTSTDSGRVFLPPIPFAYKVKGDTAARIAYTNSFFLTLTGLAVNPQGEIKDIKQPMWAPWLFEDFLPYLIGLVVAGGGAAFYYFYWRKRKRTSDAADEVKIVIPPHREALSALRLVEEKKLWQQGAVKEYYSETTEIVRRFFEKRWNIIALEMTTDDILSQMKHVPESLPVWKEMETFFRTADLVKFAKGQPTPADHEHEMQFAYDIVRAMVPRTPVVETEQAASQETTEAEHVR